jgi:predicted transcriptional regulator
MLLGRRLWHESRIALFQHAVDERSASQMARSHPTRVTFGEHWISSGAIELWRDQIMRFKPIFTAEPGEMSTAMLRRGAVPQLAAMRLHNGTVWRWNRPCYGVSGESGRPHLRIEFRALPSGPTVVDEVANAAFLLGLVHGLANETGDVGPGIAFEAARDNFFAAARDGLETQLHWFDGEVAPAAKLITSRLLPLAFRGLTQAGLDAESSNRYLKIIEDRVAWGVTGSCYVLGAVMQLDTQGSPLARDQRLVRVLLERQSHIGVPVHCWNPPSEEERMHPCYTTVGEIMSTDLSTVAPGDPVSLATGIMDWRRVHHVPVEDDSGKLVGMLSHRDIGTPEAPPVAVRDLMATEVVSVTPASTTIDALKLMRSRSIDCLPVVENGQLVGLVTSHDMLAILELLLSREAVSPPGQAASASAV